MDIQANGQHDPIHVRGNGNAAKLPWSLVAGLHRLRGAEDIGRAEIDAVQVADQGTGAAELRRLELSENLDHRQRRPIERAIFVTERARLEEEIDHPGRVGEASQARAARARWDAKDIVSSASWRERTAAAMGCTVKTLQRYERLHREIVLALPDLAEQLNFHPLGESLSAMTQLAALNPIARRAAAEMVLSRADWPSLQAALVAASTRESTGRRDDPNQPDATFLGSWARMSTVRRRVTALAWARDITPSEALAIVDVFKERKIIGDRTTIV